MRSLSNRASSSIAWRFWLYLQPSSLLELLLHLPHAQHQHTRFRAVDSRYQFNRVVASLRGVYAGNAENPLQLPPVRQISGSPDICHPALQM